MIKTSGNGSCMVYMTHTFIVRISSYLNQHIKETTGICHHPNDYNRNLRYNLNASWSPAKHCNVILFNV
jgi:hypothetical protein